MRLRGRVLVWTSLFVAFAAAIQAQTASPWQTGLYVYDGAGNIKSIGTDQFRYDGLGRLVSGTAGAGRSQTATYDPFGNLLVAGRCHSATQLAASSTRVTVTAMAMGQAAGTAAAMALQAKVSPAELNGVKVRQTLEAQHAGPYRQS